MTWSFATTCFFERDAHNKNPAPRGTVNQPHYPKYLDHFKTSLLQNCRLLITVYRVGNCMKTRIDFAHVFPYLQLELFDVKISVCHSLPIVN